MIGLYIVIGVLLTVVCLLLYMVIAPSLKKYKFSIKPVEAPKKKRVKKTTKKKKSVWIRVL